MPLPSTGAISLNNVNQELGKASPYNQVVSLNDADVRALFGIASGAIRMSDGYGKTLYPVEATGGNEIYESGNFRIHKFTSSGNFTVTRKDVTTQIQIYAVGGGRGGTDGGEYDADNDWGGNGGIGGGGGYYEATSNSTSLYSLNTAYPVVIGAGGPAAGGAPLGGTSTFLHVNVNTNTNGTPTAGGAGGLGSDRNGSGLAATSGGNSVARNTEFGIGYSGGGGGGGGRDVTGQLSGGTGGVGSGSAGSGGNGGSVLPGGAGTTAPGNGANGTPGFGAGGGGGGGAATGTDPNTGGIAGNGGSGCIIFRYQFKNFT